MTVKELIEKLQKVEDQNMPVIWYDPEDGATEINWFEIHRRTNYKRSIMNVVELDGNSF